MARKKAVFNWSGGKDSALALYKVLQSDEYEVVSLLTTVNKSSGTSSMHAIPDDLLQAQADSIGLPLYRVILPEKDNSGYNNAMTQSTKHFKALGVNHYIFGDIYLHDVRSYREKQLRPLGIEVVEPLWDKTSEEIIEEFLASGIKTKIIVTQAEKLDETYAGLDLNRSFIESLPEGIDLCGENGEYHTFVYQAPYFKNEIKFSLDPPRKEHYDFVMDNGEKKRYYYWQCRLKSEL